MTSRRSIGWAARLLRLSLFKWPARARERDGHALVRAFEDGWGEPLGRTRQIMTTLSECGAVLIAGLGMRGRALQGAMGGMTMGLVGDLRYSLRTLLRSPGFTLTVTLTLAVGIGANAAVFGLVDRVLFNPPPHEDPSSLLFVWNTLGRSPDRFRVPAPDVAEFGERAELIDAFAFVGRPSDAAIESHDGGGAEHVRLAAVTVDLFAVLGVAPLLGTTFAPEDAAPPASGSTTIAAPSAIMLSHGAWQRAFAADPHVVGRTVRMDGRPARVVGVLAPDFSLPMPPDVGMGGPVDVWTPLVMPLAAFQRTTGRQVDQDSDNTGAMIARLRPDVTIEQASAEMTRIAADLRAQIESYATSHVDVVVRPMHADATAHLRGLFAALLLGVGVVLLATCLNVSTLLLARGARRHRELAVRAALGATHLRIVRQLLTEALVLVGLGSVLSLFVAGGVSAVLSGWVPPELGGAGASGFDPAMLVLAVLFTTGATVVFGLVPALRLTNTEKGGAVGVGMLRGPVDHGRARRALVAGQVALSVVLALTTGLLLRTARELQAVHPGFQPEGAMTFAVSLRTPGRYPGPADRARLMREIETALAELPGVHAVGLSAHLPLGGRRWSQPYGLPGQPEWEWAGNRADFRTITSRSLSTVVRHSGESIGEQSPVW